MFGRDVGDPSLAAHPVKCVCSSPVRVRTTWQKKKGGERKKKGRNLCLMYK